MELYHMLPQQSTGIGGREFARGLVLLTSALAQRANFQAFYMVYMFYTAKRIV